MCNVLFGILAFEQGIHRAAIGVAEGEGEGVGDVVGFGNFRKFQDAFDHDLHLLFLGAPVAGKRLLYLERCVFGESNAKCLKRQENRAAGLTHRDDCFLVFEEKYLFNGRFFGRILSGNFSEIASDFGNAFGERECGARGDVSVGKSSHGTFIYFEDAPSDRRCSGINTEDSHVIELTTNNQ